MKIELEGKVYDLDINQAKKLNLLREEDTRCKSWEEFKLKYKGNRGYFYESTTNKIHTPLNPINVREQLTPQESIAIQALAKLLKLRRDWIEDWEPDWSNLECKYCIVKGNNSIIIACFFGVQHTFSFPTEKMAKEFLECFKDLFEQCKNII